jgi:hypothetical protein
MQVETQFDARARLVHMLAPRSRAAHEGKSQLGKRDAHAAGKFDGVR